MEHYYIYVQSQLSQAYIYYTGKQFFYGTEQHITCVISEGGKEGEGEKEREREGVGENRIMWGPLILLYDSGDLRKSIC